MLPSNLTLSGTVTLGEIIEAATFVGIGASAWFSLKGYVREIGLREQLRHEQNLSHLESITMELKKQNDILVQLAVQKTMIDSLIGRITELERKREHG